MTEWSIKFMQDAGFTLVRLILAYILVCKFMQDAGFTLVRLLLACTVVCSSMRTLVVVYAAVEDQCDY